MNINVWKTLKRFCKYSGNCDDQQQYLAIFKVDMISTTKGNTGNRTMLIIMSLPVKNSWCMKTTQ